MNIYSYVTRYLRVNQLANRAGSLHLFSDLYICDSCRGVEAQFNQRFPGIRIYAHSDGD
ncbi:MAG: deaminase domain-containing protein [Thermoanaerobaculia bacterium]